MGLDNGIYIRNFKEVAPSKVPWFVMLDGGDVCYWRKCWGIRCAIYNALHAEDNGEKYEFKVEEDDIPAIIKELEKFLDKDYWNENADSIWEYEDIRPSLIMQIKNLLWLRQYMLENPKVECYFYDSY
jgi:hypothetical protein